LACFPLFLPTMKLSPTKYLMILGAAFCLLGIASISAPATTTYEAPTAEVAVEENFALSPPTFHAPNGVRGLLAFAALSGGTFLLIGGVLVNWHDESPVG